MQVNDKYMYMYMYMYMYDVYKQMVMDKVMEGCVCVCVCVQQVQS